MTIEPKQTKKNIFKEYFGSTIDAIQDYKKKISITAAILLALA